MQLETDIVRFSPLPSLNFHPDFSSPDGNVVLAAKDAKMYFRVHSYTLKTTSGFFKAMYSLPQSTSSQSDRDIMYLDEDADILETLLRMVCGLPLSEIGSHELLDTLLYAAEKYEMPGPMALMRMHLLMPSLADNPIRLYAIARRYDWQEEAKLLSTRTLSLNIYDKAHHISLRKLSPDALLDLFLLHRGRREGMQEFLDGPPFVSGTPSRCSQCETPIDYTTWRELKHRIVAEMDQRPLGDNIEPGLSLWREAVACWRAACPNDACKRLLYDRAETIRVIREGIEQLAVTT